MIVVFVTLGVLVVAGAALLAIGRIDPRVSDSDRPPAPPLPEGSIGATDVRSLRFRVGLRGYRMSDVDAALAAVAAELDRRDELARRDAAAEPGEPAQPAESAEPATAASHDVSSATP